jgi:hypothetical protein
MKTEIILGRYADCIIDLHILKEELSDARLSELTDETDAIKEVIEEIWEKIHSKIEEKLSCYQMVISNSCLAPYDIEDFESEVMEQYFEQTEEV